MPTSPASAEQYSEGGIAQLVTAIERRTRQPGAELYLVTTHAGEPIVGNISSACRKAFCRSRVLS